MFRNRSTNMYMSEWFHWSFVWKYFMWERFLLCRILMSPFTFTDNSCREVKCLNDGTCYEHLPEKAYCLCKQGYTGQFCEIGSYFHNFCTFSMWSISIWIEYFRCRSNGRFTDQYNCAKGKYFECVHYYEGKSRNLSPRAKWEWIYFRWGKNKRSITKSGLPVISAIQRIHRSMWLSKKCSMLNRVSFIKN